MSDALERLDRTLAELQRSVEEYLSMVLSKRYADRPYWFSHLLDDPAPLSDLAFNDLLMSVEADGRLTRSEARKALWSHFWSHLILHDVGSSAPRYLIIEVGRTIRMTHVRRVAERAVLLRKAGLSVQAAVAGINIQCDALDYVTREGIGRVIEQELDGEDPTEGAVDAP